MRCRHCGKEIPDDSIFCPLCGGSQSDEPLPPAQPPADVNAHGFATASFVCGIIGILVLPIVFGTLGVVFGLLARRGALPNSADHRRATLGLILGVVGLVTMVFMIIYLVSTGFLDSSAFTSATSSISMSTSSGTKAF